MKAKILGLLAVGMLAGPMAANALTLSVDGKTWEFSTITGTFQDNESLLKSQTWWTGGSEFDPSLLDSSRADLFAAAVEFGLGNQTAIDLPSTFGPFFAYGFVRTNTTEFPKSCAWTGVIVQPVNCGFTSALANDASGLPDEHIWVVAKEVAVPEPGTLALLGLGLAGLGLSRRRKAN